LATPRRTPVAVPLVLFALQLALNALWSPSSSPHRIDLALADIAVLWLAILATIVSFWRVSPRPRCCSPYLAWVSFASALNFALWRLNS